MISDILIPAYSVIFMGVWSSKLVGEYKSVLRLVFTLVSVLLMSLVYKEDLKNLEYIFLLIPVIGSMPSHLLKIVMGSLLLIAQLYFGTIYIPAVAMLILILSFQGSQSPIGLLRLLILVIPYFYSLEAFRPLQVILFSILVFIMSDKNEGESTVFILLYILLFSGGPFVQYEKLYSVLFIFLMMVFGWGLRDNFRRIPLMLLAYVLQGSEAAVVYYILSEFEMISYKVISNHLKSFVNEMWIKASLGQTLCSVSSIYILSLGNELLQVVTLLYLITHTYRYFLNESSPWEKKWYVYLTVLALVLISGFYIESPWSFYMIPDVVEAKVSFSYLTFSIILVPLIVYIAKFKHRVALDLLFKMNFYQSRHVVSNRRMFLNTPAISRVRERFYVLQLTSSYADQIKILLVLCFCVYLLWGLF